MLSQHIIFNHQIITFLFLPSPFPLTPPTNPTNPGASASVGLLSPESLSAGTPAPVLVTSFPAGSGYRRSDSSCLTSTLEDATSRSRSVAFNAGKYTINTALNYELRWKSYLELLQRCPHGHGPNVLPNSWHSSPALLDRSVYTGSYRASSESWDQSCWTHQTPLEQALDQWCEGE